MRYSTDQRIARAVEVLLKLGWVSKGKRRHLRLQDPVTGAVITVPGTPSDYRAVENWFAQVKRSVGIDLKRELRGEI